MLMQKALGLKSLGKKFTFQEKLQLLVQSFFEWEDLSNEEDSE